MKYFVKLPATGQFVRIEHGDTRYMQTTVETQSHADSLNEAQGISPVQAQAALICSMGDNWAKFHDVVRMMRGVSR